MKFTISHSEIKSFAVCSTILWFVILFMYGQTALLMLFSILSGKILFTNITLIGTLLIFLIDQYFRHLFFIHENKVNAIIKFIEKDMGR